MGVLPLRSAIGEIEPTLDAVQTPRRPCRFSVLSGSGDDNVAEMTFDGGQPQLYAADALVDAVDLGADVARRKMSMPA